MYKVLKHTHRANVPPNRSSFCHVLVTVIVVLCLRSLLFNARSLMHVDYAIAEYATSFF